ncbi:MAG: hypothetical protein EOO27_04750 [Comamonadaceae bacterium]|nr:MAG: hypothetical protein EOO27_04750 [Comamonadaceae bacterium]
MKGRKVKAVHQARFEQFTLERLHAHAREEDGHLIWTGAALKGRTPQVRLGGAAGMAYGVRRVIFVLLHGVIPGGTRVTVGCDRALCVHPDCLVARKPIEWQRGKPVPMLQRARITATKRRQASVMTPGLVRRIREGGGTAKAIDEALGLKPGTSSKVRTGKRWGDLTTLTQLGGF